MPTKQLPSTLSGVAGEYFVAAELSRRGYIASITLRNTKGIDILASNQEASKSVGIQVKTSQGSRKAWVLTKKAEDNYSDNFFYPFVNLKGEMSRPDYHIVPSKIVADTIREDHALWLKTPGRGGKPHKDNPVRKFFDADGKYLEKWEELGLD